jgi:hypothetical protein
MKLTVVLELKLLNELVEFTLRKLDLSRKEIDTLMQVVTDVAHGLPPLSLDPLKRPECALVPVNSLPNRISNRRDFSATPSPLSVLTVSTVRKKPPALGALFWLRICSSLCGLKKYRTDLIWYIGALTTVRQPLLSPEALALAGAVCLWPPISLFVADSCRPPGQTQPRH